MHMTVERTLTSAAKKSELERCNLVDDILKSFTLNSVQDVGNIPKRNTRKITIRESLHKPRESFF